MSAPVCYLCGQERDEDHRCPPQETQQEPTVEALAAFTVLIGDYGQAVAYTGDIPGITTRVVADERMIRSACMELADELHAVQVAREVHIAVSNAVADLMPQPEPTAHDRIMQAMNRRRAEQDDQGV